MTEVAEGWYVDTERKLHNADGSLDELARWVDEKGYIRTAAGEFDGYTFVDAQGGVHDANGMENGSKVGVPDGWSVQLPASQDGVAWDDGDPDVLSTTVGSSPSP